MSFSEAAAPSKAKCWSIVQWIRVQKRKLPSKCTCRPTNWRESDKTRKSLHFWALQCEESRYRRHNKIVKSLRSTKCQEFDTV